MNDLIEAKTELGRLRNRHVAKLLEHLGDTPPYMQIAIKKAFTMFVEDVETNILNSGRSENHGERANTL